MAPRGVDVPPRLLARLLAQAEAPSEAGARGVRELEHLLGEPLLSADGLTPAGELVARSARRVLDAVARFGHVAHGTAEPLRVAHLASADTLPTLLAGFAGPTDEQVLGGGEHVGALRRGRIDVAVCPVEGDLPDDVDGWLVRRDPLVAAFAAAGPLLVPRYGAAFPQHDAAVARLGRDVEWVHVPAGSGRELDALRRRGGGRPVVIAASALSPGTPRFALTARPPSLAWHVAWRREGPPGPARAFVAHAREAARRHRWTVP